MNDLFLFYAVFLVQIGFISYYLPKIILQRFNRVMQECPPDKYPKLYNKSADYYELGATIYRKLNTAIVTIGLLILLFSIYQGKQFVRELEFVFVLGYFFLQMLPVVLMELSSFSYFKEMRALNKKSTRKAEIKQRKLFDFVSKKLFFSAVFSNLFCVLYVFFLDDFILSWKGDTFAIFLTLLFMNVLYFFIVRFNLYGKKQDPYQSSEDRAKQTAQVVSSLVKISLIASLFLTITLTIEFYRLDAFKAAFLSLYLQLIVWISMVNVLKNISVDEINFEVYKAD